MNIGSVINKAVAGVDGGLNQARNVSGQLNFGAPQKEADVEKTAVSRIEKAADADLGTIVDETA